MAVCEGCGSRVDEAHLQRRTARSDLAKRFQPVRIRTLFLDGAPPPRLEDYFYNAAKDRATRSAVSRSYFDELLKATAAPTSLDIREESALGDFQRRGFFLFSALECPFEEQHDPASALRRAAPTAIKRVQSLDPSYIVPLTPPAQELIRLFGLIGWGDRLILSNGGPFVDPYLGDPQKQAMYGSAFGDRIRKLLAVLP